MKRRSDPSSESCLIGLLRPAQVRALYVVFYSTLMGSNWDSGNDKQGLVFVHVYAALLDYFKV